MRKFFKFFIYGIPLLVILAGIFVLRYQNKGEKEPVFFIDYKKLEELTALVPQGEKQLNFIRENEALLLDEDSSNDADAYIAIGFYMHGFGDDLSAISAYKEGLKLEPENSFGLNNIASSYKQLGMYEEAEEAYRKLAVILSGDSAVYRKLADTYSFLHPDDEEGIVKIIEEGLAVSTEQEDLLTYLGTYFRDRGKTDKAIEYFEKLVRAFPGKEIYQAELEELRRKL